MSIFTIVLIDLIVQTRMSYLVQLTLLTIINNKNVFMSLYKRFICIFFIFILYNFHTVYIFNINVLKKFRIHLYTNYCW